MVRSAMAKAETVAVGVLGNVCATLQAIARIAQIAALRDTGDTPLHKAIMVGNIEIVTALLGAGRCCMLR